MPSTDLLPVRPLWKARITRNLGTQDCLQRSKGEKIFFCQLKLSIFTRLICISQIRSCFKQILKFASEIPLTLEKSERKSSKSIKSIKPLLLLLHESIKSPLLPSHELKNKFSQTCCFKIFSKAIELHKQTP